MLPSALGTGNEDKWLLQLILQEDVCMKNGITSKDFCIGPYPYAKETRLACKNSSDWHLSFIYLLRGITRLGLGKNNWFTNYIDHMEIEFIIVRNGKIPHACNSSGREQSPGQTVRMVDAECPSVSGDDSTWMSDWLTAAHPRHVQWKIWQTKRKQPPLGNQVPWSLSLNVCTQIMSETGQIERGFTMKDRACWMHSLCSSIPANRLIECACRFCYNVQEIYCLTRQV